ncbi:hypothetical protein, partial [Faecalibaculum rodentium]|uniref:hypothetical protein n=1 Tax=Faecalibaculum rodentium TaxID=1702221 RepID=UPI0023F567F6
IHVISTVPLFTDTLSRMYATFRFNSQSMHFFDKGPTDPVWPSVPLLSFDCSHQYADVPVSS